MTLSPILTSSSRMKRIAPEGGLDQTNSRDIRARTQTVRENSLPSIPTGHSPSPSIESIWLQSIFPLNVISGIGEKYAYLLQQPFIRRAVELRIINVSTRIVASQPYTHFEVAIYSKTWDVASVILKNNQSLPISMCGISRPQMDLRTLSWVVTHDQWKLAHQLLSRDAQFIEAELPEISPSNSRIKRMMTVFFDQSKVIKKTDYSDNLKNLFMYTLNKAIRLEQWDIVYWLVMRHPNIPSEWLAESTLRFIFSQNWPLLKTFLQLHPSLAGLKHADFPFPTWESPFRNASVLWLLAYYNQRDIISSISTKIDPRLFFETPMNVELYSQTSAFDILALGDQNEIIQYLLNFVKDNTSYDSMRLPQLPYSTSIIDHAVKAHKWHLLLFILKYYLLHKRNLPNLRFINPLSSLDQIIHFNCLDDSLKEQLLQIYTEIVQYSRPIREIKPAEEQAKLLYSDPEDPRAWEGVTSRTVENRIAGGSLDDLVAASLTDEILTESPVLEELFSTDL